MKQNKIKTKYKTIFKTLLTLLLMVAAGQGSAWAQTFEIQDFGPDHDPGYNDNNQQSWNDNNNSLFGDW